jgi:hypothetical protein
MRFTMWHTILPILIGIATGIAPGSTVAQVGGFCITHNDCGVGRMCANGVCIAGDPSSPGACHNVGGFCGTDGDCCNGLTCDPHGICMGQPIDPTVDPTEPTGNLTDAVSDGDASSTGLGGGSGSGGSGSIGSSGGGAGSGGSGGIGSSGGGSSGGGGQCHPVGAICSWDADCCPGTMCDAGGRCEYSNFRPTTGGASGSGGNFAIGGGVGNSGGSTGSSLGSGSGNSGGSTGSSLGSGAGSGVTNGALTGGNTSVRKLGKSGSNAKRSIGR